MFEVAVIGLLGWIACVATWQAFFLADIRKATTPAKEQTNEQ